jgi:hypothetical protein
MNRRNIEEITYTFRKYESKGIYRVRGWFEHGKLLPGNCEEWIISEFLEDVTLNQSFKRCGYTVVYSHYDSPSEGEKSPFCVYVAAFRTTVH